MSDGTENAKSIFDAAKTIAAALDGMEKADQERVIRWISETLGIKSQLPPSAPIPTTHIGGGNHETPHFAPPSQEPAARPKDIKTFLDEKQPKSDNQYAAAVAYFYRFEAAEQDRTDTISAETLQEAARLAGRSRLGNPGATLNNATGQGYLDRVEPGKFKINTVGENLVAMTLSGGEAGGSAAKKTPARKARTKKKPTSKKSPQKKK